VYRGILEAQTRASLTNAAYSPLAAPTRLIRLELPGGAL
jgi:hypothetical protein